MVEIKREGCITTALVIIICIICIFIGRFSKTPKIINRTITKTIHDTIRVKNIGQEQEPILIHHNDSCVTIIYNDEIYYKFNRDIELE